MNRAREARFCASAHRLKRFFAVCAFSEWRLSLRHLPFDLQTEARLRQTVRAFSWRKNCYSSERATVRPFWR
jgi:hypothetical protein